MSEVFVRISSILRKNENYPILHVGFPNLVMYAFAMSVFSAVFYVASANFHEGHLKCVGQYPVDVRPQLIDEKCWNSALVKLTDSTRSKMGTSYHSRYFVHAPIVGFFTGFVAVILGMSWEAIHSRRLRVIMELGHMKSGTRREVKNASKQIAKRFLNPAIRKQQYFGLYTAFLVVQGLFLIGCTLSLLCMLNFRFDNPFRILALSTKGGFESQVLTDNFPPTVLCHINVPMSNMSPQTEMFYCEVLSSERNAFAHVTLSYVFVVLTITFLTNCFVLMPYEMRQMASKILPGKTQNKNLLLLLIMLEKNVDVELFDDVVKNLTD